MTASDPKPRPIITGERREHLNVRALAEHGPRNEDDDGPKRIDQQQ